MPHRRQPWYVTGLHFCGSCLVTLACWAAWLALSASLACLLYIALAQELPVPDFVLRRIEADLARANLAITFGRAHLDPTGKILFEDVQLRVRQFEDPLVTSRLVYLRRNIWSVLSGRPVPDEIRLEGAALQTKVDAAYRSLAERFPERIVCVDGDRPPGVIQEEIREQLRQRS